MALIFLLSESARAVISEANLMIDVTQEQIQQSKLNAKRSDGRRDTTKKQIRVLNVECRSIGSQKDEPVTFRWFFIGKDPLEGKFDYYSQGRTEGRIPRSSSLKLRIVSDALEQDNYVEQEFLTSVFVTSIDMLPHGWVLWVLQNGKLVKATASTPDLIEWMKRNPPPREQEKPAPP